MTNYDFYADKIKEMILSGDMNSIAVKRSNMEMCSCSECTCNECLFRDCCNDEAIARFLNKKRNDIPTDLKLDEPILVSSDNEHWLKRYFAKYYYDINDDLGVKAFSDGRTSWSAENIDTDVTSWTYAKRP